MRYWDDMRNKYGFNDGEAQPFGCDTYRSVYLMTVNTLATSLGSNVRATAYDRPGTHNGCMIVMTPESVVRDFPLEDLVDPSKMNMVLPDAMEESPTDKAMATAIGIAMNTECEEFIETKIRLLLPDLRKWLKKLNVKKLTKEYEA